MHIGQCSWKSENYIKLIECKQKYLLKKIDYVFWKTKIQTIYHIINCMNIAIIIGVSEYTDPVNNLPGCKSDASVMNSILTKSEKYQEILYINEKISSAKIKEKLTEFIAEHKTKEINELFFYFTGHGEYKNEEFYYILSDFKTEKRKQTSLQNEEVDTLFKTLKPNLVVKVIDACHSGQAYIKEPGIVKRYFDETKAGFNKCYFLNSSSKDQSSFQSQNISDFTLSFINSLKEHDTSEIRYKDVIDFISDEFEGNNDQTPFFVVQADYTEKFCVISDALNEYLRTLELSTNAGLDNLDHNKSLIEKVKSQAVLYLTKDQALALINRLKERLTNLTLNQDLTELYDLEVEFFDNYEKILNKNVIGKWLDDNGSEFFAKSLHIRVRKDGLTGILDTYRLYADSYRKMNEEDYKWERNGFELEVEVPYKTIVINLNSKFPNVDSYTARIVYLISQKNIRLFYFITNYEVKNWDDRKLNPRIEWVSTEHLMSDETDVEAGINDIFERLVDKAKRETEDKIDKLYGN